MSIKNKVNDIRKAVEQLAVSEKMREKYSLPSNCYFLNEDEIVCGERKFGDSRYPYSQDGLTLWAHSSGNVKIEESTFNVILNSIEGKEPNLAFYLGEKKGNTYFPLSITGAGKLPFEENIKRYTVYTPDAVYYMADTTSATTCVRMFVDQEKNVRITAYLENKTEQSLQTYFSAYFNCMLSHGNYEYIETKWYRSCQATESGFAFSVTECLDRNTCLEHKATLVREVVEYTFPP